MALKETFKQLLADFPKQPAFSEKDAKQFYALGFSLYGAGSFQESTQVFEVLCLRKPLEYPHWFGLASSFQETGRYEKALNAWAMAAILDRSSPHPHFHAAECCFSLGQIEEAKTALNAALARADGDSLLQDQISLLLQQWSQMPCL